jgi:hypothetical protein
VTAVTTYFKCAWLHSYPDEPRMLYSELDDERWETRKVEVFPDGTLGFAPGGPGGRTELGDQQVPPLEEIASNPEFEPEVIEKEEFEAIWRRATETRGGLPRSWVSVEDSGQRSGLERELVAEIPSGHVLAGKKARAIARRVDQDDVLFEVEGGGCAVVHLTWAGRQDQPRDWPRTTVFESLGDWRIRWKEDENTASGNGE